MRKKIIKWLSKRVQIIFRNKMIPSKYEEPIIKKFNELSLEGKNLKEQIKLRNYLVNIKIIVGFIDFF